MAIPSVGLRRRLRGRSIDEVSRLRAVLYDVGGEPEVRAGASVVDIDDAFEGLGIGVADGGRNREAQQWVRFRHAQKTVICTTTRPW